MIGKTHVASAEKGKYMRETLTKEEAAIFAAKLEKVRKEWDLSRGRLGVAIGCSENYIYLIERQNKTPSVEFARNVCKMFGLSYAQMTKSDESLKEMEEYGKSVRKRRESKNLSRKTLADLIGENEFVIKEVEEGRWALGNKKRRSLESLFGESVSPSKEKSADTEHCRILDLTIEHVKDINVTEDVQKSIFHCLRDIQTKILEEKLFA